MFDNVHWKVHIILLLIYANLFSFKPNLKLCWDNNPVELQQRKANFKSTQDKKKYGLARVKANTILQKPRVFPLDATFADNFGHICRQLYEQMESSWNPIIQHSGVSAGLQYCNTVSATSKEQKITTLFETFKEKSQCNFNKKKKRLTQNCEALKWRG